MMTKQLFGRGAFLLRTSAAAAAACLILMESASAQATGQDMWKAHPGDITSCSNFATNEVDWYGTVTLHRPIKCETPKVVHIMDNTAVLVRSNDVLAASNVHFVVHDNAKLILAAKNAIMLDRHESSTQPLFTIFGEVVFKDRKWTAPSLGDGSSSSSSSSTEDTGGIIRMEEGGMLVSEHDVRYSPNAITIVTNAAAMPGKVQDVNGLDKKFTPPGQAMEDADNESSAAHSGGGHSVNDAPPVIPTTDATTPATPITPTTPTSTSTSTSIPDPTSPTSATTPTTPVSTTSTPSLSNDQDDSVRNAGSDQAGQGARSPTPSPTPTDQGNTADPPGRNEAPGGPEPEPSAPNEDDKGEEEEDKYEEEEEEEEDLSNGNLPPPLQIGDVLLGEMKSENGDSAMWPVGDGKLDVGWGHAGSTPAPDNSHSRQSVSEWSNVATLLEPNHGKVRAALRLREKVRKEKENDGQAEGVSQSGREGARERKTKSRAFFGWRRRVEREELERARDNFEEVAVTIDDRACLKVTIDGTPVLEKSGKFRWELLNRFPWKRPRDDGYEVHVVDSGIEVQLRGRAVWGIRCR